MRPLLAAAASAALVLAPCAGQASPGCKGCNLVDEGVLNDRLVGQTAYLGATPYTVTGIDAAKGIVYARSASGEAGWGYAREFHPSHAHARPNATGAVAGVSRLICALGACSNAGSGSAARSPSGTRRSGSQRASAYTSVCCDRASGACH